MSDVYLKTASRLEAWLISAHKAFNRSDGLFTENCGFTLDFSQMVKVHQRKHLDDLFCVAHKMSLLRLTQEEICVFKAICILQSGKWFDFLAFLCVV